MGLEQNRFSLIYRELYRCFGPQRWWPATTPFEVMVGAILTQNTNWNNVEKAIANLKRDRLLNARALWSAPHDRLAGLIRPAGYYNIKAARLRAFTGFFLESFGGRVRKMEAADDALLRRRLLEVNGIGEETADSIMLYALNKPVFVVDAYTRRIFSRHGLCATDAVYGDIQAAATGALDRDVRLYNEYHALIVRLGKEYCRKTAPLCEQCPLHTIK